MPIRVQRLVLPIVVVACAVLLISSAAHAESRARLQTHARQALEDLYKTSPGARALAHDAKGILIFPSIVKGGFVVGASYGDGVLFKGDTVVGYYNSTAGSFGF